MYLHKKHIHPSVLAVMEREGHKQVNVPASVRKTVTCKMIGESLVIEGYTETGRRVVVETTGSSIERLIVPINENEAFVMNAAGSYERVRIDEGLGNLMKRAGLFITKMYRRFMGKLSNVFGRSGAEKKFYESYKKNPEKAIQEMKAHLKGMGKTDQEIESVVKSAGNTMKQMAASEHGMKAKDPTMMQALAGANDRLEQAGNDPKAQDAAMREGGKVMAVQGDRIHQEKEAKEGKAPAGEAPAQKPAEKPAPAPAEVPLPENPPALKAPATAAAPEAEPAAPAPAAPAAPAGTDPASMQMATPTDQSAPKDGDAVEMTDATGNKVQGKVVTVDEAGAKKWNDLFAGKSGYSTIKAGTVVKTDKGFVPLDKNWTAAAAPAADPAAAPGTAAAQPEVKPVPAADGSTPTNVPPATGPVIIPDNDPKNAVPEPSLDPAAAGLDPAAAGLTDTEQGPGPAAEPAFDPNATMAQPAAGPKPGIPAGAQQVGADTLAAGITKKNPNLAKGTAASAQARSARAAKNKSLKAEQRLLNKGQGNLQASSFFDHRKPVNERLMTMAEIDRLLKGK